MRAQEFFAVEDLLFEQMWIDRALANVEQGYVSFTVAVILHHSCPSLRSGSADNSRKLLIYFAIVVLQGLRERRAAVRKRAQAARSTGSGFIRPEARFTNPPW